MGRYRKDIGGIMFSKIFLVILACCFFLPSCTISPAETQNPIPPNPGQTAAAETIIAQLTDLAKPIETTQPDLTPQSSLTVTASTSEIPAVMETQSSFSTLTPIITTMGVPETAIISSTITSQPVYTLPASDPKLSLGNPTWKDTFDVVQEWPLFEDEHAKMEVIDGDLKMISNTPSSWDSWMITQNPLSDFYLEASVTTGECSGMDRYGLFFRSTNGNDGYLLGFSCDGKYSLRSWNGSEFATIIDWTTGEPINDGSNQTNQIGVKAVGNQLSFYANGSPLANFDDNAFSAGSFGLFIGSGNTSDFTVLVHEIAYWDLISQP